MKQRPCDESTGGLLDEREVKKALKNVKAPGSTYILPEMGKGWKGQ